jgi:hypothetical protein
MADLCSRWHNLRGFSELYLPGTLALADRNRVCARHSITLSLLCNPRVRVGLLYYSRCELTVYRSPRWLMRTGNYGQAYLVFQKIRPTPLQAAREYANINTDSHSID